MPGARAGFCCSLVLQQMSQESSGEVEGSRQATSLLSSQNISATAGDRDLLLPGLAAAHVRIATPPTHDELQGDL